MASRHKRRLLAVELLEARDVPSTFYVATTGSDSHAGSSTSPWATLQHAVDSVSPGDTILVESGTYAGCRIGNSGAAGADITLKADSGAQVLINAPGPNNAHNSDIEVENFNGTVSHWIIDGLEVSGAGRSGIDARDTDSITVRNCTLHNNTSDGIFLAFSDHALLENNTSYSNSEHGIYDSDSGDYATISGNVIHDNADCGIHLNGDISDGGDGIITGVLIAGNTIYNNGATGGSAIDCDGVQSSTIQNNLLYNNHASGISLFRIDGGGPSTNNLVVNNTIDMASDARWALNIQDASTGNTALNNILYNHNTAHGSIDVSADSLSGFTSDYNAVVDVFTPDDGNTTQTLAQWQSATGQDLHSFVSNPSALFVNESANDYHLSATSPAVDAGTSQQAPATDLEGNPRPSGAGYDIGAYELQQTGTPPPVPFSPVVVDNSDPGYQESGTGWKANGTGYDNNSRVHAAGKGANTATWTVTGLPVGTYDVSVTWVKGSNRATNATYQIYDGSTLVGTVSVNQRNAPTGTTVNGRKFQSLGQFQITSGTLKVVLSDNANGYVDADAIRVAQA